MNGGNQVDGQRAAVPLFGSKADNGRIERQLPFRFVASDADKFYLLFTAVGFGRTRPARCGKPGRREQND